MGCTKCAGFRLFTVFLDLGLEGKSNALTFPKRLSIARAGSEAQPRPLPTSPAGVWTIGGVLCRQALGNCALSRAAHAAWQGQNSGWVAAAAEWRPSGGGKGTGRVAAARRRRRCVCVCCCVSVFVRMRMRVCRCVRTVAAPPSDETIALRSEGSAPPPGAPRQAKSWHATDEPPAPNVQPVACGWGCGQWGKGRWCVGGPLCTAKATGGQRRVRECIGGEGWVAKAEGGGGGGFVRARSHLDKGVACRGSDAPTKQDTS